MLYLFQNKQTAEIRILKCRISKSRVAPGLRSHFGGLGLLSRIEKVMSAED
jgi:hypothetical protein